MRCHLCADDARLQLSGPGPSISVFSHCVTIGGDWMQVNQLKRNPDKTKVMVMGKLLCLKWNWDIYHWGVQLLVTQGHGLEVLLDPLLHLDLKVAAVARRFRLRCGHHCIALHMGLPSKAM